MNSDIKNNYSKVMAELKTRTSDLINPKDVCSTCNIDYQITHTWRLWYCTHVSWLCQNNEWLLDRIFVSNQKNKKRDYNAHFKKDYFLTQENERLCHEVERLKEELEQEKLRPPELGGSIFKECETRYLERESERTDTKDYK